MPASDPKPNAFRAALLKMVFDKTHPLYPTQFDKQHRDYALATKAKRMLTQLSQGQTPEDSLTEAEIEQAAYRRDHWNVVGDKAHPLNRALFDKQNPNNKAASQEMKHIQALGYPDQLGQERVAAARDFFGDRHPDRILAGMDYYRNALKPLKPLLDGIVAGGLAAREQAGPAQPTSLAGPARAQTRATPEYFADRVFADRRNGSGLYAGPPALDGENAPLNKSKTLPRLRAPSPLAQQPAPPRQQPQAAPARDNDIIAGAEGSDRLLGAGGGQEDPLSRLPRGTLDMYYRPRDTYADIKEKYDIIHSIFNRADEWRARPETKNLEEFKEKNIRPSFSKEDKENRNPRNLVDFHNAITRQLPGLPPVGREILLNIFFNEGGATPDGDKATFGITEETLRDVRNKLRRANLPFHTKDLTPEQAATVMYYVLRRDLSNIVDPISPLSVFDQIKDDKLRIAYPDTIYRHGASGGAGAVLDAVNDVLGKLDPKDRTALGLGASVAETNIGSQDDLPRKRTFNVYVVLANSKYAPLLRNALAEYRKEDNKEGINRYDSLR